ncbi:MAG: hypothetical protein IIU11_02495 [Bacteroidales bacterium]|nr:hypothetical protein [Bacteroidales bacterium]
MLNYFSLKIKTLITKKTSVQRSGYQRFDDSYNYDFQIFVLGEIINDI